MDILLGSLIIFAGGLVQGCAGFGLALVTAPLLVLLMPHTQVPPLLVLLGLVNNLLVLLEVRASVKLRLVLPLVVGGFLGLPGGAYLLKVIDPALFKVALGVIVILAASALFFGLRLALRSGWRSLLPVGLLSGVLGGSTSLSGPPAILFFANQGVDKQRFRANLIAYFTLLNIGSIATFWLFGLLGREVLTATASYMPALLVGSVCGMWVARRINDRVFKRVVLVLIALIGAGLVVVNLPR